ncbi:MAG: hypothetical protein MHM6MM_005631 [Cercozoa sp. M6MM]
MFALLLILTGVSGVLAASRESHPVSSICFDIVSVPPLTTEQETGTGLTVGAELCFQRDSFSLLGQSSHTVISAYHADSNTWFALKQVTVPNFDTRVLNEAERQFWIRESLRELQRLGSLEWQEQARELDASFDEQVSDSCDIVRQLPYVPIPRVHAVLHVSDFTRTELSTLVTPFSFWSLTELVPDSKSAEHYFGFESSQNEAAQLPFKTRFAIADIIWCALHWTHYTFHLEDKTMEVRQFRRRDSELNFNFKPRGRQLDGETRVEMPRLELTDRKLANFLVSPTKLMLVDFEDSVGPRSKRWSYTMRLEEAWHAQQQQQRIVDTRRAMRPMWRRRKEPVYEKAQIAQESVSAFELYRSMAAQALFQLLFTQTKAVTQLRRVNMHKVVMFWLSRTAQWLRAKTIDRHLQQRVPVQFTETDVITALAETLPGLLRGQAVQDADEEIVRHIRKALVPSPMYATDYRA